MRIYSYSSSGYQGDLIHIEVDILPRSLPGIDIVGLPGSAVKESKVRFRSAMLNSGYSFPAGRVIINMSPAGKKKEGACFDLPFACSVIFNSHKDNDKEYLILGELKLDGSIRGVSGVLAAVSRAYDEGINNFILPFDNRDEATLLERGNIYPVSNLKDACRVINGEFDRYRGEFKSVYSYVSCGNFSDIKGQEKLKRGLEIAVAGGHNALLFGPPGVGKSMAVNRLASILPKLTKEEALETTKIWSLAGKIDSNSLLIDKPPIRKPYHGASLEGLVGGGKFGLPGEVSLAHNGYLFLDEMPEFKTSIIQSLREPLEDHKVSLNRASISTWFPSNFRLIATANPCPCGNLGKKDGLCMCSEKELSRYWKRLGGAIMDRIDIRIPVEPITTAQMMSSESTCSNSMKMRVTRSVEIQQNRFKAKDYSCNSRISPGEIEEFCYLDNETEKVFKDGVKKLNLSSRGYHSVLKIARTIADLGELESINNEHILEALDFRRYGDDDYYFN